MLAVESHVGLVAMCNKKYQVRLGRNSNSSNLHTIPVQQEMLCLRCIYFQGQPMLWMELTLGIHQQGGYWPSSSMGGLSITLPNVSLFVLLLMAIHYISTFIYLNFARKTISYMYCLPLHLSHLTQPLDMSFFKPLKSAWGKACNSYCATNPGF